MRTLFFVMMLAANMMMMAGTGTWKSTTTGTMLNYKTTESKNPLKDTKGKLMTIVYLENLACEKIGQNSNAEDVAWLVNEGYRVIEIDYAGNEKAVSPTINQDIIAINDALNTGEFCGCSNISTDRAYVLFEGYKIARNVGYYMDDPKVYNLPDNYTKPDSLYMDIVYPANPSKAVPTLLSFSYSNSYHGNEHKRMFLGYTLAMFDDSVQEGAPARGMAWAIADHPKYCDWGNGKYAGGPNKSLGSVEIATDAARKLKAAVRTLRHVGKQLGLGNDVALYGFSRGSTAASLGIGDKPFDSWTNKDRCKYADESSDVQVAVLGPGVFDYSKMPEGSNEYKRMMAYCDAFKSQPAEENYGGALAIGSTAAPCFLFYNHNDEAYYDTQVQNLITIFKAKGVEYELLTDYGTGHAVPQKTEDLAKVYDFLCKHTSSSTGIKQLTVPAKGKRKMRRGKYALNGGMLSNDSVPQGIYIADGKKYSNR